MTMSKNRTSVLRGKCVGVKVTDEEYAAIEALAFESHQTVSSWARAALMAFADHESPAQTVLEEVLALRQVLLNLHFAIGAGAQITQTHLAAWIQAADAEKSERARARLFGE